MRQPGAEAGQRGEAGPGRRGGHRQLSRGLGHGRCGGCGGYGGYGGYEGYGGYGGSGGDPPLRCREMGGPGPSVQRWVGNDGGYLQRLGTLRQLLCNTS